MEHRHDDRARLIHLFSSPLTALRGAIDLLRQRRRTADDPVIHELFEALDRSSARLRHVTMVLLAHSRLVDERVEIVVPLSAFEAHTEQPAVVHPASPVAPAAIVPTNAAAPPPPTHPTKVLIVEDSAAYRRYVGAILLAAGYEVLEVAHGVQAVDMARQHHPDVILLDLELPGLDGRRVAQVLSEDPETKSIPLLYSSAHSRLLAQLPPSAELLPKNATADIVLTTVRHTIAAAHARAAQTPTLLVVDDDADIQQIVNLTVQEDGYRVLNARTGTEALLMAQKQPFDLIILDLLLPDIDGFSVLGALRARSATALTPIILLSARDTAQEKVHGLQLGADDYVTKPFSPAELQARVRAALRRRERETGANPSTRLPGNIAIEQAIRHRIDHNAPFAVCYSDLDNFKAYNDNYGFLKGDAVIHQTAHVLVAAVEQQGNSDDFVGHIGGDDFIVITTPDRAERICQHVIANFDTIAPLFYDHPTRQLGYIEAEDRQGRPSRFPFVSISIAVVSNARHPIRHLAEVAQRSIPLKKRAKEIPGSAYVLENEL